MHCYNPGVFPLVVLLTRQPWPAWQLLRLWLRGRRYHLHRALHYCPRMGHHPLGGIVWAMHPLPMQRPDKEQEQSE